MSETPDPWKDVLAGDVFYYGHEAVFQPSVLGGYYCVFDVNKARAADAKTLAEARAEIKRMTAQLEALRRTR